MQYRLLEHQLDKATKRARALAREGRELCGLLVWNGYCLELVELRNKSRRPGQFGFYKREVRQVQEASNHLGHEVIGTYHSHPFSLAAPGKADLDGALDDTLMLILDVTAQSAHLWYVSDRKAREIPFTPIR